MNFSELSSNQRRISIDLKQTYEGYREAVRTAQQYAGGFHWKSVNGQDYLVKVINRRGGTKGFGRRSPETEAIYEEFIAGKARAKEREASLEASVHELAGMARGVLINRVPSLVAALLRKLDNYGLLGKNLMVIGTNAMYGYESVAGVMFDSGLLATTDVDLLWDSRTRLKLALLDNEVMDAGVLAILRKVDRSFEATGRGSFRAINKEGFYVDLVKQTPNPPWKRGEKNLLAENDLRPSWLPNIKWLLASEKFASVVIGQDGLPAPMVSPDPRAFAVYKRWLSDQPDREAIKRSRDRQQAQAVIDLVQTKFPHMPLDANAERMFPREARSLPGNTGFAL